MSYYNIGIIDNFDKEFDYSYSDLDLEYEDIIKNTIVFQFIKKTNLSLVLVYKINPISQLK
jgi:hypothetical protein